MTPASPYLTAREAMGYLRFQTMNAFYKFRYRHGIKSYRRGGVLLFKQADLDRLLDEERPTHSSLRRAG